jgi:spore coat polysaccharide biosynthesis predicted glycosyltransferase SpsG
LGKGAREADLVINSIYPEESILPKHYCGQAYFLLRDEFLLGNRPGIKQNVKEILITFGGVDPNNYTLRILSLIHRYCRENDIGINIVAGFGYDKYETISGFDNVNVYKDVNNISEHMSRADLIFTSAGRTIYEVAALGLPAIVLAQNERELLHFFANEKNGFVNLGLGAKVSDDSLVHCFVDLATNAEKRLAMSNKMKMTDFKTNRKRVNDLVNQLLED